MARADIDHRMHLLHHNRAAVMVMLGKSVATGLAVEDLVALVVDTMDTAGRPLARAMAERDGALDAEAEAARVRARGEIPTLVACVAAKLARALFELSNPGVRAGIERPPARGRLRVVVVGANGSMLVHVPVQTMPVVGSA
jgi:hypothetical protein